jgi:outer membrane protein OmpA-like peptidoglycan-associated protein
MNVNSIQSSAQPRQLKTSLKVTSLTALLLSLSACGIFIPSNNPARTGATAPPIAASSYQAPAAVVSPRYTAPTVPQTALNQPSLGSSYAQAKAQCWEAVAYDVATENNRSVFVSGALQQAALLKAGQATGETPLIAGASKIRPVLWAAIQGYKSSPNFNCVATTVACMEVELVHAGHEYAHTGWKKATPYVQMVEELNELAAADMARCGRAAPMLIAAPAPIYTHPVYAPAPVVQAPPPIQIVQRGQVQPLAPVVEQISLNALALFKFDQSAPVDIRAVDLREIDAFVVKIKQLKSVQQIAISGYADPISSEAYNKALSLRRAETVAQLLRDRGIPYADRIALQGLGRTNQFAQCESIKNRQAQIECNEPNRRVIIQVRGER